jgi:hypothetical protein
MYKMARRATPHRGDPIMPKLAKNRLTQTFGFLKELNERRNAVPRDLSSYTQVLSIDEWLAHQLIEVRYGDRKD